MAVKQNSKTLSTNLHVQRKQNSFGVGLKNDDQFFQQSAIRYNQQAGGGQELFFSGMAYRRGRSFFEIPTISAKGWKSQSLKYTLP